MPSSMARIIYYTYSFYELDILPNLSCKISPSWLTASVGVCYSPLIVSYLIEGNSFVMNLFSY